MALEPTAILEAVRSHALASGWFERVGLHEPKSSPGTGVTAAVWVDFIGPATGSGLASTSGLLVVNLRVYTSMLSKPQDEIDPNVLSAVDALLAAYAGDFTLGGLVRCVDLRGMSGTPMQARAGYLNQDGRLMRVMTITLPLIVNDLWDEVP